MVEIASQTAAGPAARRSRRVPTRLPLVVAVVFVIVLASSAIKNSMTAYLVPMDTGFGVSRGRFTLAPTLFMVTYAVMSPVIGFVADRFGGKRTMLAGLALGAAVFAATAAAHGFLAFTLLYGIGLAAAYTAVSYVPLGVLVDELFDRRRRGIAYALLTNGTAVGFIVLSPLWITLSGSISWRSVYAWLGLVFAALLALGVFAVPARSAGAGGGDGAAGDAADEPSPEPAGPGEGAPGPTAVSGGRSRLGTVLRTRGFWWVALPFMACGMSMAFIDVSMVADMQLHGVPDHTISQSSALLGAAEITGAVIAGWLVDRKLLRGVLVGSYALRVIALMIVLVYPDQVGSLAFGLVFGASYMGTVIASTVYVMQLFDRRTRGLALGLLWLVHQVGASLSSAGSGLSFDMYGSYNIALLVIASAVAAAVVLAGVFTPTLTVLESDAAREAAP